MITHVLAVAIPIFGLTAFLSGYFFCKSDNAKTKFSELKMDNSLKPTKFCEHELHFKKDLDVDGYRYITVCKKCGIRI